MLNRKSLLLFLVILAILFALYLTTLQTIPNGSEHYFMIDVGETQIVLNRWGTLHATGYPLYVMIGNVLVTLLRGLGVSAAAAPGVTSLIYGLIALALIYTLSISLIASETQHSVPSTQHFLLPAVVVLLFGLTRTMWVHNSIAEIYTFGLMILVLLLLVALWPRPIRGRIYWLAFIGGIGVFHHRALIMVAPALLYAVWEEIVVSSQLLVLSSKVKSLKSKVISVVLFVSVLLLIGLIGFLPYLYLPLRAGASWVYGEPGTWSGFWDQFLGREADRFIGVPSSLNALAANFNTINAVLATDLTAPGILLGLLGLLLALRNPARRRAAITLILSGGVAYLFHIALYTDILSALILPIDLSLAFGWLLLGEWVVGTRYIVLLPRYALLIAAFLFAIVLVSQNLPFIRDLTTNTTGLETIALAKETPRGATLMLDWGPRNYAVGFARDVLGELPDMTLISHKADFRTVTGELVTADFTFYNRPVSWWEQQLGTRVYLRAVAPHLVQIDTQPEIASTVSGTGIQVYEQTLDCTADALNLQVSWVAASQPEQDLSVFVHLLDAKGTMIGQGDEIAPVYGWRPLTSWGAGEIVRDVYPLPRLPDAAVIRYGLYHGTADGAFVNDYSFDMAVKCDG